ncbi:MAG: T9SS type A sorting domain-containing protein [Bacteroidetes bacterium]|nr:T9SS type A sorting domain-containing protein [Bacteroidota bacterium]MBL7105689.1 T9SS type A sorting domain-containing protein [Bacteroidales bacterium]
MKKFLLFVLAISFGLYSSAQNRAFIPKAQRDVTVKMAKPIKFGGNSNGVYVPGAKSASLLEDTEIGTTIYDLQTNSSTQNRMYLYDDGFMGAVWTMGFNTANWPDRGTGYNTFDGNSWGDPPTERIEDEKCGWPSYTLWGDNGEIIANHTYYDGIWVGRRDEKGIGDWTVNILGGPPGAVDITWPRTITTGPSNNIVHVISTTYDAPVFGQTESLLYSRSSDGGNTWDIENHFFEELGPDYYTNIGGDVYEFAQPKDGILAFLVGDSWTDLVLMKSMDDGDTWEKIVIWECPYPLNAGITADTFYCVDGSHHLAFDNSGLIHVVFGINRAMSEDGTQYWFPFVDGVGYWNESMPAFSDNLNALSPYGDPGSELIEDYNLIGWTQDVDGDGQITFVGTGTECIGNYYLGLSSMVQLVIDDINQFFLIYSSVTETYDNNVQNYRHVWARSSIDGGNTWGPFYDLNSDLVYIFDECVFPSCAPYTDDNIYYAYQADEEPGLHVRGDEDPPTDNYTRVMKVGKDEIIDAIKENKQVICNNNVSQNYPNPFVGTSTVFVNLDESAELSLEVHNIMGQLVYELPAKKYNAGKQEFIINGTNLEPGIYFYTVRSGESSVTKKMIVK